MNNNWHTLNISEIMEKLDTTKDGISDKEANLRLEKYGLNKLNEKKKKSLIKRLLAQFKDFSIIILIIAAIVSGVIGILENEGIVDTIVILIVVMLNAIIGVIQEQKAEKSLESLQKLSNHNVKVVRDGKVLIIPSVKLTVGDIVIIETGDYISADLRIIESVNLKSQESSLTGESTPVEKDTNIYEINTPLAERKNMLYSTSLITYGRGSAIVVETGMNTEVGKIAKMLDKNYDEKTPLQIRLDKVGKTLGIAAIIICIIIFIIGIIEGKEILHMFMTSVSLAVAAIPEGLVAVSTIVLAIGVEKMVKKNAIIKKLASVETLGSASVICSDKTGTLTQNKMTVTKVFCNDKIVDIENIETSQEFNKILESSLLCNDSKILEDNSLVGDPTETCLTELAIKKLVYYKDYLKQERIKEIPFDSERKLMTVVIKSTDDKFIVYTKGAVDELLKKCTSYLSDGKIHNIDEYKNTVEDKNKEMANNGLRVLSFAFKELDYEPDNVEILEENLTFVGLLGMIDPPRKEVMDAIKKCKNAGIKTVMITGDHKLTAIAIARKLGILESDDEAIDGTYLDKISDEELIKNVRNYSVYARVSPEHKVRIVDAWQKNGEIVAMTGDGVNDSPALKKANIGCAMGIVGTEVSKEAADLILTDDNFSTIVGAVEEGRKIYDNILKVIQFLISSNIGEVTVLLLSVILSPFLAKIFNIGNVTSIEVLLPIHILWINLVTDTLPALSLAFEEANDNIMNRKPIKSSKNVFTKGMIYRILYQGIMIGLLTLLAFVLGVNSTDTSINGMTLDESKIRVGQTMVFITLSLIELVHVFNIRDNKKSIFKTNIFKNKILLLSILSSLSLILIILFVPALRDIFNLVLLSKTNILQILILIIIPILVVELFKLLKINTIKE